MIPKRKFYSGNWPNSPDYQDNVPIGWNKWDAEQTRDETEEEINEEDEPEEVIGDEDWIVHDDEYDTDYK